MEGTHYNLVIYGGNPAGLACAVRAAREGLTVLLVNHTPHIGGLPANGMGLWDTLYEGWRSPIYNEMRQAIFDKNRQHKEIAYPSSIPHIFRTKGSFF